jgi:ribulose 1,5-bisphosphate synthetase/thiazole synthase
MLAYSEITCNHDILSKGRDMSDELSRRELIRSIAAGGLVAAGSLMPVASVLAYQDTPAAVGGPQPPVAGPPRAPATVSGDKVIQPQRELPVLHKTQVLVVGGGPAGTAAALAARRLGVDVTMVERYGHLGGLATGGLVLAIFPIYDLNKKQVILGIGEEMLKRLDGLKFGIIDRNKAPEYPIIDAEAFKYLLAEMVMESGMTPYLDCWGVDAIIDAKGAVRGAVFESKSGRQAILADIVIDATGDGDIYAAAGAVYEKFKDNIGLVSRIGNVDLVDRISENPDFMNPNAARPAGARPAGGRPSRGGPVASLNGQVGSPTPVPRVNWLNMKGPVADGLDVADLTSLELKHRRAIWNNLEKVRQRAGAEQAYLVETAPQIGIRRTRSLGGVKKLTIQMVRSQAKCPDVIGYSGAYSYSNTPDFQIPYGSLVPAKVENLLAAGRCISADFDAADITRLIPVCWVTGQAAGVAAAMCIQDKCKPRAVNVAKLQDALRKQGAYLG